jgi:hypothetical protein
VEGYFSGSVPRGGAFLGPRLTPQGLADTFVQRFKYNHRHNATRRDLIWALYYKEGFNNGTALEGEISYKDSAKNREFIMGTMLEGGF